MSQELRAVGIAQSNHPSSVQTRSDTADGGLRVALVVPEYATGESTGGVATMADFFRRVAEERGWTVTVLSPRMSRRAAESRQLLAPRTWMRPIRTLPSTRDPAVTQVGAHFAEVEAIRYLPRRPMDMILARCEVVVVIAGSPAMACSIRRVTTPLLLHFATLVSYERQKALATGPRLTRPVRRLNTRIIARLERIGLRRADCVAVLNSAMADECNLSADSEAHVLYPGVDTQRFQPTEYRPDGPIVMVSRLADARKDYGTLFDAVARLRDQGVHLNVVLAGRGTLRPSDQRHLAHLELPLVTVRSDLSADQLVELLRSASMFVSSSTEEGLGISMIEAMACGLPVVSTATSGAREVLGDSDAGELVPPHNSEALATAIRSWCEDAERRRAAGLQARARAEEHFSHQTTVRNLVRLVEALAASDRGTPAAPPGARAAAPADGHGSRGDR